MKDQLALSLINNYLKSTCEEMGLAMMRTGLSPIFNEGRDFSCVLFNRQGAMIAQADFVPSMVGAILYAARWTIEELGIEVFHPGDVIVHNDPYRGGCHLPEHMVIKPIFYRDELFGFAASMAHFTEIGGMAVGGFAADATDIHQEGLRIPPVKIVSRGKEQMDLWRLILANHRTPEVTWGDMHSMFGSLNVAERRLAELLDRYGLRVVNDAVDRLLVYAEEYMKAEIQEIPDGVYSFDDFIEDDGVRPNRSYRIHCSVMVAGNRLLVDFSGSDQQAAGAINCTYGVTASATYNAVLQVTNSEVPRNSGAYEPIRVIAPPGTVVNVRYPHAEVGGNSEIHGRIVDLILACLSLAIPERVNAATGGGCCNLLFGGNHPDTGRYYAGYHFDAVGWGANAEADGNDMLNELGGNCRTIPVEIFESKYPWRIDQYSLEQDSAGSGKHRGGFGMRKLLTVLAPEINVSAVMDRLRLRPYGLHGGKSGKNGGLLVRKRGEKKWQTFSEMFGTQSDGKFSRVVLREGDQVLIISPGGGGFGDPGERDPAAVAEDVREHLISTEKARADYGLLLHQDGTFAGTEQRLATRSGPMANEICAQPTRRELRFDPFQDRQIAVEPVQVEKNNPIEETRLYCRLCGQLIPKTYFVVRDEPAYSIFCSDECAVIHFNRLDAAQAGAG